jgi:hypothetical protein
VQKSGNSRLVHCGWRDSDWHDMEGEVILIDFFNRHYDLAR